jgi:hypothetical protein
MLVNQTAASSTQAIASTPKQISVRPTGSGGVMYTVPAGKTFTGFVVVTMGNGCQLTVNNVDILSLGPSSPYFGMTMPITLLAGSVVSSGGSYMNWSMYGVEQ